MVVVVVVVVVCETVVPAVGEAPPGPTIFSLHHTRMTSESSAGTDSAATCRKGTATT